MSLSITPGTNNVGAYINNVDLTNLNNNQATEIKKTLDKFGVIFIKNQNGQQILYFMFVVLQKQIIQWHQTEMKIFFYCYH